MDTPQKMMPAEAAGRLLTGYPRTMRDMLLETATTYGSNHAVVSMYQRTNSTSEDSQGSEQAECLTWTYQQLNEEAEGLASSLFARGIRPGMRFAVFLQNSVEWAVLFWASVKLGTAFVPLDARAVSRKDEVHHYLSITNPSALFVGDGATARIMQENNYSDLDTIAMKAIAGPSLPQLAGWTTLDALLAKDANVKEADSMFQEMQKNDEAHHESSGHPNTDGAHNLPNHQTESDLDRILYILFTSGTSSLPKACPLTDRNIWASTMAAEDVDPIDQSSIIVQHAPPSHSMGIVNMIHAWTNGAKLVIPSPTFDAKRTLEAIDRFKCTHMTVIPTMLLAILKQPTFHPQKTQSLQRVVFGGTIIPPTIIAAATDPRMLGASEAVASFGMTEGLPICACSSKKTKKFNRGAVSLGQIVTGVKVRICHIESRKILARGEVGELHFSGDLKIKEYVFGDKKSFYTDHTGDWIATGDQALMDSEGNLFVLGRFKDIIIRGGENLSPALIESCIGRAGVLGQVIGVPDEIAGEVPLAVVQVPEQHQIPTAKINEMIMESLGPTCLPTAYMTLADIGLASFPMTTSGKVRKIELREAFFQHLSVQTFRAHEVSSVAINVTKADAAGAAELRLIEILTKLIGQPAQSIPREQPISTILDSINVLRFQASIQKATGKNIAIDSFLRDATISSLAGRLDATLASDRAPGQIQRRQTPPTAVDMVHTHGETGCVSRTRAVAEPMLQNHGISWGDVEDIFPIPDLSSRGFEAMRPMAFSIRITSAYSSSSPSLLRDALELTLRRWSIFRSFATKLDNTALFVTIRACTAMSQASITELPDIESPEELRRLRLPESSTNNVHLSTGGPLARFTITRVKSTGSVGLMMLAHHATYDAISLQAFSRDLEAAMRGGQFTEPYTDYKLFADTFYLHSSSIPAQTSAAFHVNRLRGISSVRATIWPPQRCPGWFIGPDTGHHIPPASQDPLLQERSQLDNDDGHIGMIGIRKTTPLPNLPTMRTAHSISPPTLFKAACALLNTHLSPSPSPSSVLFSSTQAGRQWPFLSPALTHYLPNPVAIAGNTLALVLNRIHIHPAESVGDLLNRLENEQHLLTQHAHAPTIAIAAQLNPADAAAFNAGRRQLLNWNPGMADIAASQAQGKREGASMELVQVEGFTEVMLEWHCGVVEEEAVVVARWDGAQFRRGVVEGWAEGFVRALGWVAGEGNWERGVGELDLRIGGNGGS